MKSLIIAFKSAFSRHYGSSRSFVGSSINQCHLTYVLLPAVVPVLYCTLLYCTVLTYVLLPAVVPAGGHEDVVAAHHLLAHAAAQVEGRAAERLPAS